MWEANSDKQGNSRPIETWRQLSLLVLEHGQQNCDLTVRTMRNISDETRDAAQTVLLKQAAAKLHQQLEEQHQLIKAVIRDIDD